MNNKRENNKNKSEIFEEVIILMDSNRKYIDENKLWRNHTCKKLKAGDAEEAWKVVNDYNFKKARYLILGIGTNDVETTHEEDVCKEIINIGIRLKKEYPLAKILISQLPPRKDEFANKKKLNEILKRSIPESLYIIRNDNLTVDTLYDKKHLKKGAISLLVGNMKNTIRSTFKEQENNTFIERRQHVNKYQDYPKQERNMNNMNANGKIGSYKNQQDTITGEFKEKMLNIIKCMNSMINNK